MDNRDQVEQTNTRSGNFMEYTEFRRRMISGKMQENKWKKALFGAAIGTLLSAVLAVFLYLLSGQGLYLAIIGLGAGIGFSIGGGLDTPIISG